MTPTRILFWEFSKILQSYFSEHLWSAASVEIEFGGGFYNWSVFILLPEYKQEDTMNKWQVLTKSTLNWLAIGERRGLKNNFGAKCHSQ